MADEKIVSAPESNGGAVEKVKNNVTQMMGLLYGLGMMMFSGWNQMLSSYWNFFMTNAVGLSPEQMGAITSISSTIVWFIVFVAAIVVEKIWFRWGQYRSYLLIAPPLALLFTMGAWTDWTWMGVETGSMAQVLLIGGCYIIGQFFINLFMISATSLIPAVSHTEADRALLSARKAQCQLVIKLLFAAISLPMIIFFAGGDLASNAKPDVPIGYTITSFIWGILFVAAFVGLFMMFKGKDPTEEYCKERAEAKKKGIKLEKKTENIEKVSVWECIKFFFTNLPALGLWIGEVGRAIWSMVLASMAVYYCTAVFDNAMLYAGMMTLANACGLVGAFAGEALAKLKGSRFTYILGCLLIVIPMAAAFFIAAQSELMFTVLICISFFGGNMMMSVEYSCMSNGIAYQEWKNGKTAKAFIMGTIQWCPNIGKILQGIFVGFGLAAIGYSKDAVMTPDLVTGISFLTFMVPAIAMLICTVAFFFMHRLTTAQMEKINYDLEQRREKDPGSLAE